MRRQTGCRWIGAAVLAAACAGCGDDDTRDVLIDITVGHEIDAFQQDPAVASVVVEARLVDNTLFARAETTPGGSFDLGQIDSGTPLRFEVSGYASDGALAMRGRSLTLNVALLGGDVLPVFVQRVDSWARPPGSLDHAHIGGVTASLGERYLAHTGGEVVAGTPAASTIAFYDMLALGGAQGGVLTSLPESVVVATTGNVALFIDASGARWIDFPNDTSLEVDPPEGLGTFAAIAGGETVRGDGVSYVVGATRSKAASDKVLVVADDFTLSTLTLTAPRQGAAAAWLDGSGLAVVGGSASAAGLEVLAPNATSFAPRPYPPDACQGAAAASDALPGQLLVVGGLVAGNDAGARRLDLGCSSDCTPNLLDAQLPLPLSQTQAFRWSGGDVLVVGHASSDDLIHSYLLATASASLITLPLREPRRGARVVAAPNGTLALMGGELANGEPALTVETLFPR